MPPRGRAASANPPNRFDPIEVVRECADEETSSPRTRFFDDASKEILSENKGPDTPFRWGLNPYRGCEHGCAYCYARTYHEYLGFSAGLDFETKILVKRDAPELLRRKLASRSWKPETIWMSGATDPYQPVERTLRLTRRCLEVLAEFLNPVSIITKNRLVARDADVLGALAKHHAACVQISVTTLDPKLHRVLEPRTSSPRDRLKAVERLVKAGVPTGVWISPVIPGLNDHEVPELVSAAADAGATHAACLPLNLRDNVREVFSSWLDERFPDRKAKVLKQIGSPKMFDAVRSLFRIALRKTGMAREFPQLSSAAFRRNPAQFELF